MLDHRVDHDGEHDDKKHRDDQHELVMDMQCFPRDGGDGFREVETVACAGGKWRREPRDGKQVVMQIFAKFWRHHFRGPSYTHTTRHPVPSPCENRH